MYLNLRKARKRWAMVSRLLAREGASPKVSASFYKAIVQSTLLYGSETWVITSPILKALDGFHHRIARRLANQRPRRRKGKWVYPPIQGALQATGLLTVAEYIRRRQATIRKYVVDRPIYSLCAESDRMSGTPTRTTFWWEQTDPVGLHNA